MTRGPERSRKLPDVVRETEAGGASGISEVTLLGQTVNSYTDGEHDFADLVRAICAVQGITRVWFTSPHPNDFCDRIMAAIPRPPKSPSTSTAYASESPRAFQGVLRRYTREGFFD